MQNDESQRILQEIGHLLMEGTSSSSGDTLLHATLEANCVSTSVFTDVGDYVLYRDHGLQLDYALLDLWGAQEPNKRWAEIEYLMHDGKFQVSFTYPEDIGPKDDPLDRRDIIVGKYFGRKRVVYPQPATDAKEFKLRSSFKPVARSKRLP